MKKVRIIIATLLTLPIVVTAILLLLGVSITGNQGRGLFLFVLLAAIAWVSVLMGDLS